MTTPSSDALLARAFVDACAPATRDGWCAMIAAPSDRDRLDLRLRSALARARVRWPEIELDEVPFAAWLGARAPASTPDLATLDAMCTDDLYLACACDRRDPVAVALLCGECFADVDAALRSYGLAPGEIDDVRQQVIEECVVARADEPTGVARYRGVGALRRWLRTIAVRRAARTRDDGSGRGQPDDRALLDTVSTNGPDPELAILRARYREALATAFAEAMAELSARERNLLRQYFLDRLGIDALALMYGVHRSTAARWVAAARRTLSNATITRLAAHVGGALPEIESLVRVVHSQIDLSIGRLLGAPDDAAG